MSNICIKKIPCCGCSNMDTCTLEKSENLLKELFTRYEGKERKKAIEHFEQLKKEKTGVIFAQDIERGRWER